MRLHLAWLKRTPLRKASLLGMVLALAYAAGASAISAPIHIAGTGGDGVYIRPTPDTSHPALGWMPEGASPDYHCFTYGQMIINVNVWFNVTYNGVTGYYASYYDDSSYHSEAELTAKYGVPKCGAAPPPQPAPQPPPAPSPAPTPPSGGSGGIYSIVDADGGVYFRNSPSWGDTSRVAGVGVYNGDRVQIICGVFGEPYGPYANRWWSYVQNLTRPGAGKGWVNGHFINDGVPTSTPSPGEGTCGSGTPGVSGGGGGGVGTPSSPVGARSVFYSPNDFPDGLNESFAIADKQLPFNDWVDTSKTCDPAKAAATIPSSVDTLAGWSLSRLGPIYFLVARGTHQSQIHRIILFDPGDTHDFTTSFPTFWKTPCDTKYNINAYLTSWLGSDSANRLTILAGLRTEERPNIRAQFSILGPPIYGRATYAGLWKYYLAGIWNQPYADRALICDYPFLGHEEVLEYFAWIVRNPPNGCPTDPAAPLPIAWHP